MLNQNISKEMKYNMQETGVAHQAVANINPTSYSKPLSTRMTVFST
jgi:hypothetical protein